MSIRINLLPWRQEFRKQKRKEFLSILLLSSGLSMSMVLLTHMLMASRIGSQQDSNDILQKEIAVLDKQITEIEGLQKEKERLLARMEIIQQLQTNRPQIVRLFDTIVRLVPEGLYLTALARTGDQINIDGSAESNTRVSKFMRNIESSEWITDPRLTVIEVKDKTKTTDVQFNLQATQIVDARKKP